MNKYLDPNSKIKTSPINGMMWQDNCMKNPKLNISEQANNVVNVG